MRKIIVCVVIVVAAFAVVLAGRERRPKPPQKRRITARLTGEEHAPRRPVYRGGDQFGDVEQDLETLTAAMASDPEVRGRALLMAGDSQNAIPDLREAAKDGDPAALTDLAAGLVESYSGNAADLEAVSLVTRALKEKPNLAAAQFNLALALVRLGLNYEAQAAFRRAADLDSNSAWAAEAREQARLLRGRELSVDTDEIARYVQLTGDRAAREVLQPYLLERERTIQRSRAPVDAASRLARAAYVYTYGRERLPTSVAEALQALCPGREPCARRYYTAGALHAAGRRSEAAAWLGSVDDAVFRSVGKGGIAAQLVWEQGLTLVIGRKSEEALRLFEAEYTSSVAVRQIEAAALFDALAGMVHTELLATTLSREGPRAGLRLVDGGTALEDVQAALAPKAAILRYATAGNEIVIFVVRQRSFDVLPLHTSPSEVALTATGMKSADDGEFASAASRLHDLVFAPVLVKLEGVSTIAVVPNRELAGVPFGALLDVGRGEHLAQRFTIVHAKSANAAITASQRARDTHDPTMLAIGATEFDRDRAEALPGANREISEIAAVSRCARVISGAEATPDAVQRALADNAVIHYAGHIVRRGADVRLLLAASNGRDGLSSSEIAAFRLQKPRVVVLAACRGASIDDPYPIVPTMVEAFLAAGVPTVIASSYDVDDTEAPATMRRLHELLRDGDDAAEALRKTTIEELKRGRGVPLSIRFHATGGTRSLVW
jgi:CHAT domain-containing protein/tetratricopeptide (TPR) repeat protein